MSIIKITDFNGGEFNLAINQYQESHLQTVIDTTETKILNELFGFDLYHLFHQDLVNDYPTSQRFIDVFEPLRFSTPRKVMTQGIKEMLKGFIYFEYVRLTTSQHTTTGVSQTQGENSETRSMEHLNLTVKYNNSIVNFKGIQMYMENDSVLYPEYSGSYKSFNNPF